MMDSDLESSASDEHQPTTFIGRASHYLTQSLAQDSPVFKGRHDYLNDSSTLGLGADIFALQEEDEIQVEHEPERPARAARDSGWLAAYLTSCVLLAAIAVWAYLLAEAPYTLPQGATGVDDAELEEAASLLSVIPMITTLTLISIAGSMGTLFLLSQAVKRILYALLVCGPAFIVSIAFWTWGESWSNRLRGINDGQIGTEARWACLGALVVAGLAARMIYNRLDKVEKTVQVVELALSALLTHPALFAMQLGLLLLHLIITLPFFALFLRLLLLHPSNPDAPVVFMAIFTLLFYLWTLAIFRNLSKLASSITISYWYMNRHEPNPPHSPTDLVKISFDKARGPQAGTVVLASLILTVTDVSSFVFLRLKRWLSRSNGFLPPALGFLYHFAPLVVFLNGVIENISGYSVVYAGMTGAGFWESAGRATDLIRGNGMTKTADYLLVKVILSLLTMSFSVLAGLLGILSASGSLTGSNLSVHHFYHHAFASLLAFYIPHFAVRLCSDLLSNAVDCLFICWAVDVHTNQNHCAAAEKAFTVTRDEDSDIV